MLCRHECRPLTVQTHLRLRCVPRNHLRDSSPHFRRRAPGMHPDIQSDTTQRRHEIQFTPTLQNPQIQTAPTQHRMPLRREPRHQFVLQRLHERQRPIHRVVTPLRLRSMRRATGHRDLHAQHALRSIDHLQILGSSATAKSARNPAFPSACAPRLPCSSPAVAATTQRVSAVRRSTDFNHTPTAARIAAVGPFVSHAPRPCSRPFFAVSLNAGRSSRARPPCRGAAQTPRLPAPSARAQTPPPHSAASAQSARSSRSLRATTNDPPSMPPSLLPQAPSPPRPPRDAHSAMPRARAGFFRIGGGWGHRRPQPTHALSPWSRHISTAPVSSGSPRAARPCHVLCVLVRSVSLHPLSQPSALLVLSLCPLPNPPLKAASFS